MLSSSVFNVQQLYLASSLIAPQIYQNFLFGAYSLKSNLANKAVYFKGKWSPGFASKKFSADALGKSSLVGN